MSKFVVVGSRALTSQLIERGHEATLVSSKSNLGVVLEHASRLGDTREVCMVCGPNREELAQPASQYLRLAIVAGSKQPGMQDGVTRIASLSPDAIIAASQSISPSASSQRTSKSRETRETRSRPSRTSQPRESRTSQPRTTSPPRQSRESRESRESRTSQPQLADQTSPPSPQEQPARQEREPRQERTPRDTRTTLSTHAVSPPPTHATPSPTPTPPSPTTPTTHAENPLASSYATSSYTTDSAFDHTYPPDADEFNSTDFNSTTKPDSLDELNNNFDNFDSGMTDFDGRTFDGRAQEYPVSSEYPASSAASSEHLDPNYLDPNYNAYNPYSDEGLDTQYGSVGGYNPYQPDQNYDPYQDPPSYTEYDPYQEQPSGTPYQQQYPSAEPDPYAQQPNPYAQQPDPYGQDDAQQSDAYAQQPYEQQPDPYSQDPQQPDAYAQQPYEQQPDPYSQDPQQHETTTQGKARYEDTTYDATFKGAPWANQVAAPRGVQGLIIAIAAAKGGAGKSTLSCWLSEALTASGVSVALVDANIGQPDISKMTGTWGQSPGIAALTGQQRFTDQELMEASLEIEELGLVLGGPPKPVDEAPEEMLAALALATERLAVHHDFVLVDTPVGTIYEPVFNRFVLHVADMLLVVTNPHQPTVHDTVIWVDDLSKPEEEGGFGWPKEKTIGVLNRADPKTDLDLATIRSWAPNLDILCDVPEVKGVIAAVNSGQWRCPTVAREAVAGLAQQLCQSHPSLSKPLAQIERQIAVSSGAKNQKSAKPRKGLLSRLRKRG